MNENNDDSWGLCEYKKKEVLKSSISPNTYCASRIPNAVKKKRAYTYVVNAHMHVILIGLLY